MVRWASLWRTPLNDKSKNAHITSKYYITVNYKKWLFALKCIKTYLCFSYILQLMITFYVISIYALFWSFRLSLSFGSFWFNINMSYQHKEPHCGDKTIVRSSGLHDRESYTGGASLYLMRPLDSTLRLSTGITWSRHDLEMPSTLRHQWIPISKGQLCRALKLCLLWSNQAVEQTVDYRWKFTLIMTTNIGRRCPILNSNFNYIRYIILKYGTQFWQSLSNSGTNPAK